MGHPISCPWKWPPLATTRVWRYPCPASGNGFSGVAILCDIRKKQNTPTNLFLVVISIFNVHSSTVEMIFNFSICFWCCFSLLLSPSPLYIVLSLNPGLCIKTTQSYVAPISLAISFLEFFSGSRWTIFASQSEEGGWVQRSHAQGMWCLRAFFRD